MSKYARAVAEFVNLYSRWRGINRFPALLMVFDLPNAWPETQNRQVTIPPASSLRDWIKRETELGNPDLEVEVSRSSDPILIQTLEWRKAVNETVADIVHDVPTFPFVPESLVRISQWADIIVCSATPCEVLKREWQEHDIARFTQVITGQEMGSKKEHIQLTSEGKYKKENVLMIGDAPGDMKAAIDNQARFFQINPGHEQESWENFFVEGSERFRSGSYNDDYEQKLIDGFEQLLPQHPP